MNAGEYRQPFGAFVIRIKRVSNSLCSRLLTVRVIITLRFQALLRLDVSCRWTDPVFSFSVFWKDGCYTVGVRSTQLLGLLATPPHPNTLRKTRVLLGKQLYSLSQDRK